MSLDHNQEASRLVIFGNVIDDASLIKFSMGYRVVRIIERSAAGAPLEEFPQGSSLRRLQGALDSVLSVRSA